MIEYEFLLVDDVTSFFLTECGFWINLEWGLFDFVCCSTSFLCRFETESPVFVLGPMFVITRNTFLLLCHFLMFYVIVIFVLSCLIFRL